MKACNKKDTYLYWIEEKITIKRYVKKVSIVFRRSVNQRKSTNTRAAHVLETRRKLRF